MHDSVIYKVPSVSHTPSEDTWEALRKEDPNYASLAVHWRLEAEKVRAVYVVGGIEMMTVRSAQMQLMS